MNEETAKLLGWARQEKLNPKSCVLLCKLIAQMSEKKADERLLYEILISALTEENGRLTDIMERWLKEENPESRLSREKDIRQLILWGRTLSISVDDLKPKSELVRLNLMPFKKQLSEKIRQDYPGGIPGIIKDLKLNKAAFYRFLSEERMPNEDMLKLIRDIFRKIGISKLEFIKTNPLIPNEIS